MKRFKGTVVDLRTRTTITGNLDATFVIEVCDIDSVDRRDSITVGTHVAIEQVQDTSAMTPADFQRAASDDRGRWDTERGAIMNRFVDAMTASAIADYTHQSGSRGVSTSNDYEQDIALRETREDLDKCLDQVSERIREKLMRHWMEEQQKRRGIERPWRV